MAKFNVFFQKSFGELKKICTFAVPFGANGIFCGPVGSKIFLRSLKRLKGKYKASTENGYEK